MLDSNMPEELNARLMQMFAAHGAKFMGHPVIINELSAAIVGGDGRGAELATCKIVGVFDAQLSADLLAWFNSGPPIDTRRIDGSSSLDEDSAILYLNVLIDASGHEDFAGVLNLARGDVAMALRRILDAASVDGKSTPSTVASMEGVIVWASRNKESASAVAHAKLTAGHVTA